MMLAADSMIAYIRVERMLIQAGVLARSRESRRYLGWLSSPPIRTNATTHTNHADPVVTFPIT